MIKSKTIETVEEYDESGRLVKKTVTERDETDDCPVGYTHTSAPVMPCKVGSYEYPIYPDIQITCNSDKNR